jgi:hypothetical protein
LVLWVRHWLDEETVRAAVGSREKGLSQLLFATKPGLVLPLPEGEEEKEGRGVETMTWWGQGRGQGRVERAGEESGASLEADLDKGDPQLSMEVHERQAKGGR